MKEENKIVISGGKAVLEGKEFKCAIGKNGITDDKKEGDFKTPKGCFLIRKILYRPDKFLEIKTDLPVHKLAKNDGWCDDINDENYNKQIKLPYDASCENLWREDELYDLIGIVGYNDNPPISGKGSAIFIHIARRGYSPTAGCIAFSKEDLMEIFKNCDRDTLICVE